MSEKKRTSKSGLIIPAILLALASIGILLGLHDTAGLSLTPHWVADKLVHPLVRLLCYLAAGLLIGQTVEALGWTRWLARLVSPLTRWGHLSDDSAGPFVASFVSGIVANTMLMGLFQETRITRRELVITYMVNNGLPIFLVHLPTTFVIAVSMAGGAGLVYLSITLTAACCRSIAALVYGRCKLPPPPYHRAVIPDQLPPSRRAQISSIARAFRSRFVRLVLFTVPIYILVMLLNKWGLFAWLRVTTSQWVATDVFPIEAGGVVIFALAAEFSSGMAAAGALMAEGALSVKQAAIALILGTIVATPVRAIRHQLPTHAGIFNLSLGSELLLLSQAARITSLLIVTAAYGAWG
jgi:hypothetical protein